MDAEKNLGTSQIADYLLAEANERGELLTPLKLQKLLFYADAWYMALFDEELTTEQFQAWVHGPVALSQWHRFKEYQWRPIVEDISKPELASATCKHLDEIMDVFGSESATALEIMTHQEKPWVEARDGLPDHVPSTARISKETTKLFYRSVAEENPQD